MTLVLGISITSIARAGWIEQIPNSPAELWVVDAVSSGIAWAAGDAGQVVVTADGGSNWSYRPVSGAVGIVALFAFDGQQCVVADQLGSFWRTSNGGLSWNLVYGGHGHSINGLHFFDSRNGWAVGDPVEGHFLILESTDGGLTWTLAADAPPASEGTLGFSRSFDWIGTEIGVFGTNRWVIWRTTNGGAQWDSVRTNMQYLPGVVLSASGLGLAAGRIGGGAPLLDRTTDFGQTWNPSLPPAPMVLKTFNWIAGTNEVWGVTSQSGLFQSSNGGLDWIQHVLAPPSEFIAEDVDFVDSSAGWCVGWNIGGRIFRYSNSTGLAILPIPGMNLNVRVHPNPFTADVTFTLMGVDGPVEIAIYDIHGRAISILGTGYREYRWHGRVSGCPIANGAYLYRVSSGTHVTSGRMTKLSR